MFLNEPACLLYRQRHAGKLLLFPHKLRELVHKISGDHLCLRHHHALLNTDSAAFRKPVHLRRLASAAHCRARAEDKQGDGIILCGPETVARAGEKSFIKGTRIGNFVFIIRAAGLEHMGKFLFVSPHLRIVFFS